MKHITLIGKALLATFIIGGLLPLLPVAAQQPDPETTATASAAPAEGCGGTRYFVLKPRTGYFMPKAKQTREIFGDVWETSGITVNLVEMQLCPQHQIAVRLDSVARKVGENHLYLVPLGVEYTGYIGQQASVRPYWVVSVDAMLTDLEVASLGIDSSEVNLGASVGVGAKIGQSGFVQLTYVTTAHVEDFDVCGAKVQAGISF